MVIDPGEAPHGARGAEASPKEMVCTSDMLEIPGVAKACLRVQLMASETRVCPEGTT